MWLQIGIVILIVGSILPGMYYGFEHQQKIMITYMGKPFTVYYS
jgi:predicted membrane channel-forming protein YqfA (hemolysin III family)